MAVVQTDIKRVLAYSTISQLGYMIFALGIGAYVAGIFHLMTHAFFKSLLFLGSGSIIHAAHTQNIREMGGLARKMKTTTWTFLIGALSLSGFPLLAGFWSKDEVLGFAFSTGRYVIFAIGTLTAFLTAFYMFRLIFIVFFGKMSRASEHAQESSKVITVPLIILAVPAAIAGYWGAPFLAEKFHIGQFISGHMHVEHVEFNFIPMIISTAAGLLGITLAYLMYGAKIIPTDRLYRFFKPYHKVLVNKYYIDEIGSRAIVMPTIKFANNVNIFDRKILDALVNLSAKAAVAISRAVNLFDKSVIDGLVNLSGKATVAISKAVHQFDLNVVDSIVNWTGKETFNSGKRLRLLQTGNISGYAIVMFAVLAVYIIYLIIRTII
jgi:NADH-quinone oxidoreductase subunit L